MSTKSQQYNSPYLLQLLNITFQYKSEFQFLSFVSKKLLSNFPGYLSMGIVLFWGWSSWEPNR
jgi:hypothetical protein